ncbi:putative V-type sodium ATP synthase subunit I [Chlamydia trachomatis]|nr:putative V-type sodium ATP synthase subunit I [Chlamydia trachomatis]
MIETMKRYSYFVYEPEYQSFLKQLRSLGVVHIKERTNPKELASFAQNLAQQDTIKQLKQRLTTFRNGQPLAEGETREDIPHHQLPKGVLEEYALYAQSYTDTLNKLQELTDQLTLNRQKQRELEVWGDFDLQLLSKLREAGQHIHFWLAQQNSYDPAWEETYHAIKIADQGRYLYFVTITPTETAPTLEGADLQKLPKESLSQLQVQEQQLLDEKQLLEGTQKYLAYHPEILDEEMATLLNAYNMSNANLQGERLYGDKLVILEGWVPQRIAKEMEQDLQNSGVAYAELEVGDESEVPIKLHNNRFVKAFEPLVELFSLPNYGELDPTPYIAPFFMIFFGICFGDAGYGLLTLVLATIFKRKAKESQKMLLELIQWLGLGGLVIGFLSGSFFGIELVKVPFLASIKEYFISSENMMVISLALGVIQIIFAKYIGALKRTKQVGFKRALSSYAWPTLIIAAGLLFGLPMAQITLPHWLEYILYGFVGICVLLVLFYNSPGKNIFVNFGAGLWDTYNAATGLLGDTLSYIRLFAIGLTGAVLGGVFNQLAGMATAGLPILLAIPIGAVILLIGHGINFALTTIGALVHPIRLIFVEYFNNSEYEGGGQAYNPLREIKADEE